MRRKKKNQSSNMPEFLASLSVNGYSLQSLLRRIAGRPIDVINWANNMGHKNYVRLSDNTFVRVTHVPEADCPQFFFRNDAFCLDIAYFDHNGDMWTSTISFKSPGIKSHDVIHADRKYTSKNLKLDEWKRSKHNYLPHHFFVQSYDQLLAILSSVNPYASQWALLNGVNPACILMAPHLEILCKAGYLFASQFLSYGKPSLNQIAMFNALCKEGSCPNDIFKTSRDVYSVLKNEENIIIWDKYRKLYKQGKVGSGDVRLLHERNYTADEIDLVSSILGIQAKGIHLFTATTLIQYLEHLDNFEAIDEHEALHILRDYLLMCYAIDMCPRIYSGSLKRERDVAARNYKIKCKAIYNLFVKEANKEIVRVADDIKKYDYTEGVYFIRAIRNFDDLLDESTQQHNCIASYRGNIANGSSYIFVMREVAHPESSLVTIELAPKVKRIRQKYLSCNRPVTSRSQLDFLHRWLHHIKHIA